MSDLTKDLAEVMRLFNASKDDFVRINYDGTHQAYEYLSGCVEFIRTHHATIKQNAEDVKEWEEFGRQIEKRLRHNDLGLVGGYPEMIDVLLVTAKRLRALERAISELVPRYGVDTTCSMGSFQKQVNKRAEEIMRGES